uniref:Putative secreted protein n=1 Tax=Anopheles triannulatus TaxID=58253 RepID=A0A2M4B4Q9_9DIPT
MSILALSGLSAALLNALATDGDRKDIGSTEQPTDLPTGFWQKNNGAPSPLGEVAGNQKKRRKKGKKLEPRMGWATGGDSKQNGCSKPPAFQHKYIARTMISPTTAGGGRSNTIRKEEEGVVPLFGRKISILTRSR